MLINEKITEKLKNANESYDYFLGEKQVNEMMAEAREVRFEEGDLVLKFENTTSTLSLDEKISVSTRFDDESRHLCYGFRVETWGTYQRSGAPSEQREIVLL